MTRLQEIVDTLRGGPHTDQAWSELCSNAADTIEALISPHDAVQLEPIRYQMWCTASHGHDLMEHECGNLVLYADYDDLRAKYLALQSEKQATAPTMSKKQPPCWWCSKPLSNPFGKPIKGVERNVDGNKVRMHKICSHDFDIEFRKVTAQPESGAAMDLYLEDALGSD